MSCKRLLKFQVLFLVGGLSACANISTTGQNAMSEGKENVSWTDLPLPELGVRLINNAPLSESTAHKRQSSPFNSMLIFTSWYWRAINGSARPGLRQNQN